MATGDFFTAPVEHIAAGGAGVLHWEGKTIFMDMAAPGDLVRGRITGEHGRWARAALEAVLEPSANRRPPFCPLYGRCGGCSLQHLDYAAQVAEKTAVFKELLARVGGIKEAPLGAIAQSPPIEYRNRVSFHCGQGRPAFKTRGGGASIPLDDCPVLDGAIRTRLREKRLRPPPDKNRFTCYARGALFLEEGVHRQGAVLLAGQELRVAPEVFFQSNGLLLESLLAEILALAEQADPSLPMADIYCGVGTFAAFLGRRFSRIDMVESNKTALALARQNAPGPGRRFFALRDDQWAAAMGRRRGSKRPYGFAVADPPRRGLAQGLTDWFIQDGPPCFVYVSCDPATLARDCARLSQGGYELASVSFYDCYPQTAHIEGLAFFKRNPGAKAL